MDGWFAVMVVCTDGGFALMVGLHGWWVCFGGGFAVMVGLH